MLRFENYSLKRRLVITGSILFAFVILASLALLYTAQKYNFYNERSARAQHVYSSYRAVSDHTYRKLSALGTIVEEGTLINLQERYRNKKALRAALRDVRESIAAELSHVGDVNEAAELEHFNKIELLAEEIIRGSERVRVTVQDNQLTDAAAALNKLRSHSVEGHFIRLIDEALAEELREVRESQVVAQELNTVLIRLLSVVFFCFVIFGNLLLFSTWRALSRNLKEFEVATDAYQSGSFSHRVSNNVEEEFAGLANALNKMASEVESQRDREKNTQENLETIIQSRTFELRQSNGKLAAISETRKQFLADISHELRTPLTIIQGEADVSLRGNAKTSDQYTSALRRIKEQTVHTTRLLQDLLFVARTEDGKAPIHKRAVSFAPLVSDTCHDFKVIAQERNIEIIQNLPDHEVVAKIDADRIKQVVTILLDNAVRYSYPNSVVSVVVYALDEHVILEVRDTGIGLKYNEASEVFSRFYRGNEGSGKVSGTGLGLPVAKAIIDAHGGTISLKGKDDEGTTATVTLPLDTDMKIFK